MNEFGETPTIFVWPIGHVEGQPYPENFSNQLALALSEFGIEWEWA